MDEKPRLWLSADRGVDPPALLLLIATVILLGLSYYIRAAVMALAGLFRFLLGRKPSPPVSTQPPHVFTAVVPALDKRTMPPRDGI